MNKTYTAELTSYNDKYL